MFPPVDGLYERLGTDNAPGREEGMKAGPTWWGLRMYGYISRDFSQTVRSIPLDGMSSVCTAIPRLMGLRHNICSALALCTGKHKEEGPELAFGVCSSSC